MYKLETQYFLSRAAMIKAVILNQWNPHQKFEQLTDGQWKESDLTIFQMIEREYNELVAINIAEAQKAPDDNTYWF